jgi:hypothetical protein
MEIDESEKYLATGDVNGIVKIWNIGDYCMNTDQKDPLITSERNFSFFFVENGHETLTIL